ncbi:MAG: DNA-binding transcriptional repressor MalI [Lentisphaerae bacterium ADurb.Bin242]|nr:MAG: DNA-binding transcriptional repressor MalI [Lentisphaerae bacterium ADurb.Bin242]
MKTKLSDIAAELGVSVSQVSRALSNRKRVSPELAKRVRETAERLHYRNVSAVHRKTVAILCKEFDTKTVCEVTKCGSRFEAEKTKFMVLYEDRAGLLDKFVFDSVLRVDGLSSEKSGKDTGEAREHPSGNGSKRRLSIKK